MPETRLDSLAKLGQLGKLGRRSQTKCGPLQFGLGRYALGPPASWLA
jgi:hypothetical protein